VLFFVETPLKLVALTIDDAPNAEVTPRILDVLKAHSAHATFFLIGDYVAGNEHLLERMRQDGHELGNHLFYDERSVCLHPSNFERQLLEVDRIVQPGPSKWCRPGGGWYRKWMLEKMEKHGYRACLASVYPFDPYIRNARLISAYLRWRVFPGCIVVLHDGKAEREQAVQVLERVLPALHEHGYRVVTVTELVSAASRSRD